MINVQCGPIIKMMNTPQSGKFISATVEQQGWYWTTYMWFLSLLSITNKDIWPIQRCDQDIGTIRGKF